MKKIQSNHIGNQTQIECSECLILIFSSLQFNSPFVYFIVSPTTPFMP